MARAGQPKPEQAVQCWRALEARREAHCIALHRVSSLRAHRIPESGGGGAAGAGVGGTAASRPVTWAGLAIILQRRVPLQIFVDEHGCGGGYVANSSVKRIPICCGSPSRTYSLLPTKGGWLAGCSFSNIRHCDIRVSEAQQHRVTPASAWRARREGISQSPLPQQVRASKHKHRALSPGPDAGKDWVSLTLPLAQAADHASFLLIVHLVGITRK